MRTLIDIDDRNVKRLDRLARSANRSRASMVREAIADYLEQHEAAEADGAFGLWRGRSIDGLAFQERARSEW